MTDIYAEVSQAGFVLICSTSIVLLQVFILAICNRTGNSYMRMHDYEHAFMYILIHNILTHIHTYMHIHAYYIEVSYLRFA